MSKIVIGLFDRFEDAQAAVRDLMNSSFRGQDIRWFANNTRGQWTQNVTSDSFSERFSEEVGMPMNASDGLMDNLVNAGIPDGQAREYVEGVRRDGILVSVVTSNEMAQTAADVINRYHPVDIKQRVSQWGQGSTAWSDVNRDQEVGRLNNEAVPQVRTEQPRDDQEIGVLNNEIAPQSETEIPNAGREIGVVNNEARPEMDTELPPTHQEIGRLNNEADETGFSEYDAYFRNHYNSNYANTSFTYDQYRPYYEYGYELANDPRYRGRDWSQIEFDARQDWERNHPGARWDDFRAAVYEAWMRVTGRA